MKVLSQLPSQLSSPQTRNLPAPPPPQDELAADRFAFDYLSGPQQVTQSYELPAEEAPKLSKPVLLVHGFNSGPGCWQNMRAWLTRSGENKDGGNILTGGGNLDPDGKVFAIQFSRPFNPVSNNVADLRQAIDRITAATGAKEVDVVAHSMGGLDTRLYLDQGDEKVDKLVMVATPNHGSVLADLELTFRDMGMPIMPSTDDPLVRQALTDISEVRGDNNPLVAQMNKNWPRQTSRAHMLIISGNGTPTLANRALLTLRGDGAVPQCSAKMPDVPMRNIWWTNHSSVKEHPDALRLTGAFLADHPLPMDQQEPPNIPADREMVPQQVSSDKEHLDYVINP